MKNQNATYILILFVLIVWGTIFYKLYVNFSPKPRLHQTVKTEYSDSSSKIADEDITLVLNYPDPFLKGKSFSNILATESNRDKIEVFSWPVIEYYGFLSSSSRKEEMGLLKIGGSNFLVKRNCFYDGIRVRNIVKDSILLEGYQKSKWFTIEKSIQ